MPGYDGTGPQGQGPMTGAGRGYCMLKVPCAHDPVVTGFAGLTGKPVSFFVEGSDAYASSKCQDMRRHTDINERSLPRFRSKSCRCEWIPLNTI